MSLCLERREHACEEVADFRDTLIQFLEIGSKVHLTQVHRNGLIVDVFFALFDELFILGNGLVQNLFEHGVAFYFSGLSDLCVSVLVKDIVVYVFLEFLVDHPEVDGEDLEEGVVDGDGDSQGDDVVAFVHPFFLEQGQSVLQFSQVGLGLNIVLFLKEGPEIREAPLQHVLGVEVEVHQHANSKGFLGAEVGVFIFLEHDLVALLNDLLENVFVVRYFLEALYETEQHLEVLLLEAVDAADQLALGVLVGGEVEEVADACVFEGDLHHLVEFVVGLKIFVPGEDVPVKFKAVDQLLPFAVAGHWLYLISLQKLQNGTLHLRVLEEGFGQNGNHRHLHLWQTEELNQLEEDLLPGYVGGVELEVDSFQQLEGEKGPFLSEYHFDEGLLCVFVLLGQGLSQQPGGFHLEEVALAGGIFYYLQDGLPQKLAIVHVLRPFLFDPDQKIQNEFQLLQVGLYFGVLGKFILTEMFVFLAESLFFNALGVSAVTESPHTCVHCEVVALVELWFEAVLAVYRADSLPIPSRVALEAHVC